MRTTRSSGLVIAALMLLAACTTHRSPGVRAPSATGTTRSSDSQASRPDSAAASAGSVANPRSILCDPHEAHSEQTIGRSTDDVVVGPLGWPHLKTWATADPSGFVTSAFGNDFKVGAELEAGATVTVAIAPYAPGHAGLDYGQLWSYSPAQAVTFHACPHTDTAFIGGFHVEGRQCIPLDIAVGNAPPTRIMVSFFHGLCQRGDQGSNRVIPTGPARCLKTDSLGAAPLDSTLSLLRRCFVCASPARPDQVTPRN